MFATAFLDIPPLQGAGGTVTLPGSKSISNRVLLLSALAEGSTTLHDLLDSDDTRVMLDALRTLGCAVQQDEGQVTIGGLAARLPQRRAELFLGNAGTAMRPLTAALAVLGGDFELHGVARMHERPIKDLVDALRQLGCTIDYRATPGYPPLHVGEPRLDLSRPISVRGDVSSQFLTALLMALPLVARQDIVIDVVGELISRPYIAITLNLLQRFGVVVHHDNWQRFTIPGGCTLRSPGALHVEADASSASYFIALGAIAARTDKPLRIQGVGADSIQGDIRFIDAARMMGARICSGPNWVEVSRPAIGLPLAPIDLDCNHIPDAAMTLAVMALFARGTSTLRNIASWRVKETDRIAAMTTELRKFGAGVQEGPDFIQVTAPTDNGQWQAASVATYDDHRMAMCLSLAALNPARLPVRIQDPKCVAKTFPEYFETLLSVVHAAQQDIPVICIDGPTASGKGTLAAALAQRLGYHFLDSGALYRVTALAATRAGLALDSSGELAIARLVRQLDIQFRDGRILLGREDVGELVRTEAMGMNASRVSTLPAVRTALIELQHGAHRLPGLVADGRDMGTVIFPQAPLKVYLTASAAQRAQRRHKQLIAKGISTTIDGLRADLEARDASDSNRSTAPLKAAKDARLLDNSELTVEQSVDAVFGWWQGMQPFRSA